MRQLILIENDPDFRQQYAQVLNEQLKTVVVNRNSADQAISLIGILPSIDLVVCRAVVGDEQTAEKIHQFITENQLKIPLLILGEVDKILDNTLSLAEPILIENLIKSSAELMGMEITPKKAQDNVYHSIPVYYFLNVNEAPCPIYEKNKEIEQLELFVQVGQKLNKEKLKLLINSGIKNLYVDKDYRLNLVNYIINVISKSLQRTDLPLKDRLYYTANTFQITKVEINQYGLTNAIGQLVELVLQSMLECSMDCESEEKFITLRDFVRELELPFHYKLSHLTILFCSYAAAKLLSNPMEAQVKLGYVALFSDLTLPHDEYLKIRDNEAFNKNQLSDSTKKRILEHALLSSELIRGYRQAPLGVEEMIRGHHGVSDGKGFSEQMNPSDKLISFYHCCEELAFQILDKNSIDVGIEVWKNKLASNDEANKIAKILF